MTDEQKKKIGVFGVIALVVFFLTRSKGKNIEVGFDFLEETYKDLVLTGTNLEYNGEPLYLWLAKNTPNWNTTKAAYLAKYKSNLDVDLVLALTDYQLSRFIFELDKTGQTF